jgi:ribosomal protein S18 acetylase RimI-like enzyme
VNTIRVAQLDDLPAIRHIARESWSDVYRGVVPALVQRQVIETWYSPEALQGSVTSPDSIFLIAETAARVIGFAQLVCGSNAAATLTRIYVLPSEQRRGVGAELARALFDQASSRGISRIDVAVAAQNERARNFYERLSFVISGERSEDLFGFPLREVTYELVSKASP